MSALEQDAPPAGEVLHIPGPSLIPVLNAVAITLMLAGLTIFRIMIVIGAVLFVVTTILWIRDTRREISELPLDHGEH